jgi:hypothetical protein
LFEEGATPTAYSDITGEAAFTSGGMDRSHFSLPMARTVPLARFHEAPKLPVARLLAASKDGYLHLLPAAWLIYLPTIGLIPKNQVFRHFDFSYLICIPVER